MKNKKNMYAYDVELLRALGDEVRKKIILFLLEKKEKLQISEIAHELRMGTGVVRYAVKELRENDVIEDVTSRGFYQVSGTLVDRILAFAKLFA